MKVFSFCCLTRTSGSCSGCGYTLLTISLWHLWDCSLCYPKSLGNDLLFGDHAPHGNNSSINTFTKMTGHDVKKVTQKFQHPGVQLEISIALPPYLYPQISRHLDLGCFISHPLTQNNITCWKRMPKYSSRINHYADTTEQIIHTNQLVLICCSAKERNR